MATFSRPSRLFSLLTIALMLSSIMPIVLAQSGPFGNDDLSIIEPIKGIFSPILNLFAKAGTMSGPQLEGMTRFLIWISVFAIVYGALSALGQNGQKWMSNNVSIALAFAFSTMGAIFLPSELVLQVGGSWGQVAFLILLSPILLGVLYYGIKEWNGNKVLSFFSFFLLFYIIAYFNQAYAIGDPGVGGKMISIGKIQVTGILGIVFRIAGSIAAIAMIIQLVRILTGFGGGAGGGGGGATFNPFSGGGHGGSDHGADHGGHEPPPGAMTDEERAFLDDTERQILAQHREQMEAIITEMRTTQQQLSELDRALSDGNRAELVNRLRALATQLSSLRTVEQSMMAQESAARAP